MKKFILVLLLFFAYNPAFSAVVKDLFVVDGIPATAVSVSSSEAKRYALNGAKEKAFFIVLKRLVPSEKVKEIIIPDNYNMEKFIGKFKISGEKVSPVSYQSLVDIQINKELMIGFLKNQGVEVLLDAPPATLIIPYDGFGNVMVGEWVMAFSNILPDMKFDNINRVPFSLPHNNIEVDKILEAEFSTLMPELIKNNVNNIIVAKIENRGDRKLITLYDKKNQAELFFETDDDNLDDIAREVIGYANDIHKNAVKTENDDNSISVVVSINDVSDLNIFENLVVKFSDVKSLDLIALKYNKAQFKLKYSYDLNSLINSFERAGYSVEVKNNYLVVKK